MSNQKLSKKQGNKLASLINSMEVAQMMRASKAADKEWDRVDYYRAREAACTVILSEVFGIDLPTLETALQFVDRLSSSYTIELDEATR